MNETDDFDFEMADAPVASNPKPVTQPVLVSGDDDADDFMADMGITHERTVPDITKPWMKHHKFELIQTIDRLNEVIDAAIAAGECALDLETEGLDNRIFYREDGSPYTKHNIVGFCLSYDGITGFYAPIRHKPDDSGTGLNLPIAETEAAIKRLCVAAQPVVSPKGLEEDPLAAKETGKDGTPNWLEKPKLVIYFWHAKFDQEFLYPITGIDWWHPESFEDGNLIYFVHYSGDKALSLKDKAKQELRDIDGNPYEMIKLQELFIQGRKDIHFEKLAPDEPGCVKYACSDGICTFLLCTMPRAHETNRKPIAKIVRDKYHHTYRIEKQTSETGRWMERPRVRVNKAKIEAMRVANLEKRDEIANKIASIVIANGFPPLDIASPKQLGEFLFSEKGLNISMPVSSQDWPGGKPPLLEKSGQYSTNADTLERMVKEHPSPPEVLKLVVEWREFEKLNGTYLDSMVNNIDERGEMRFQFKQTGAQTGRYSAPAGDPEQGYSGIPIHGIPGTSALRQAFEARPGYTFVKTDYAAQELRIAANVSGEEVWIKEFLEGDGDLHSITARAFFGKSEVSKDERKQGKCVHPDTLIFLDGKLTSMKALAYPEQEDSFQDSSGHTIFDGSGSKKVTATYYGGIKSQVHVVTSGGIVTCTPQHQFLLRDGKTWVKAGELQKDMLLAPTELPKIEDRPYREMNLSLWEGIPESKYTLNNDLAYFAGLYVGDGTGSDSSVKLTHGEAHIIDDYGDPYADWIKVLTQSAEACGLSTTHEPTMLYLGSRVVVRLFRALGIHSKRSKDLRLPTWVLEAGPTAISWYLAGLFDTDGTVSHEGVLDWTTKDFVLAGQVATALKACGLDFNTELTFNKTYERYYVRLRLTGESAFHFKKYMKYAGKVRRLKAPIYAGRTKDRFAVLKVLPAIRTPYSGGKLKIELPDEQPCLDLTVEDSHVYVANGFITHNTANFALIYGGGPAAIMRATGCDKVEATRRKQAFDKSVPTFAKWVKGQHRKVKEANGIWNALGRWIATPAPRADLPPDEIRKQEAARERFSTNAPIQSCGADIMKIALILLNKEFYKRGWLRQNNGDDSVRMLLTVHDEIVFEIRNDRVQEVIPILESKMVAPGLMATPKWRVPLTVESTIGLNWGGECNYEMLVHGKPHTPDHKFNEKLEVIIDNRVYHQVPPWLDGLFIPPYASKGSTPPKGSSSGGEGQPIAATAASAPSPVSQPVTGSTLPSAGIVQPAPPVNYSDIIMIKIGLLNKRTVKQVGVAIAVAADPDAGKVLCLTDASGHELISPSRNIRVLPELFRDQLVNVNLTDGTILPYTVVGKN